MAVHYNARQIPVFTVAVAPPRRSKDVWKLSRFALGFFPSAFRIAKVISSYKADVVHVNTSFNLQGAVAAKIARRPLVWHVREIAGGSTFDRLVQKVVCLLANRIVAISNAVADAMRACSDRVVVIKNGLDLSPYDVLPGKRDARAALGLPLKVPIIITIGRLEPWKGQHVLLDAAPHILDSLPNALLLIVGGPAANKPEYAKDLESRCKRQGLDERVRFLGVRDDVSLLLAASDLLVLPSVEPEPFGRTIIEAMAAGLPVVATAGGGPSEIVLSGQTGWLVPSADPHALAAAALRLLTQPEVAKRFGDQGRQRAYDAFSLQRLSTDVQALVSEIVTNQKPGKAARAGLARQGPE